MSHLTHDQRTLIENGLRNRKSFKEIARDIGKAHTTVSREVQKHCVTSDKGAYGRVTNRCIYRYECKRLNVCGNLKCQRKCSCCAKCNEICPDFHEDICHWLSQPPYVCNGCPDEHRCVLRKKYYIHDQAEIEYREVLSGVRTGATLNEEERLAIGVVLNAGLEHGQSVHHIMASRRDDFQVCEKSVYRYINSGLFLQRPGRMELPKAPGMKPRRKKGSKHKVDTKCRIGRTLEDYTAFLAAHPDNAVVEMDSVIGSRGGKVLLTFNFNNCTLMLAFLRDANTSQSVIDIFNRLEILLGPDEFKKLFPVILTDNGTEFTNPDALEKSHFSDGRRTRIFYCDSYSSWQKGHVENNHENLRKIFPKGESLDSFTQQDVNLALSHLNSFARVSLNDVPAIELFEKIYGKEILDQLGIRLVDKKAVCLTPMLLKK